MSAPRRILVWLVTGASSGFDHDLVLAALVRGDRDIAIARSRSVHKLDDLREKIYGRVDVLFNNAGYAYVMAMEESTSEETQDIFTTNVFGGLNLARVLLPGMRSRKEGTILWNESTLGCKPVACLGMYSATKSCLRGMSQALHEEIAPLGLRSIIIEPNFYRTNIIDNINSLESRIADYDPMTNEFDSWLRGYNGNQLGDTKRAVEVVLDMIRGEGAAEGKTVPMTLPLGSDSYGNTELMLIVNDRIIIMANPIPPLRQLMLLHTSCFFEREGYTPSISGITLRYHDGHPRYGVLQFLLHSGLGLEELKVTGPGTTTYEGVALRKTNGDVGPYIPYNEHRKRFGDYSMGTPHKQLVWLVTGASTGFGHDLALAALARGDRVIATARSKSVHKLDDLRERGAAVIELDVKWPFEKLKSVSLQAEGIHGRVDVLFNNAGYSRVMSVEETTPEETQDIFNANVFGGLNLARALLPGMRSRKEGFIVWNGSMVGWMPDAYVGLYAATKSCLRSLSQALHEEIAPLGLRSIVIEPGHHRTNIIDNLDSFEPRIADYGSMKKEIHKWLKDLNSNQPGDPKRAVEVILDMVHREGVAEGRTAPMRLPLGSDSYELIEGTCKEALQELDTWKDVIVSTDISST